MSYAIQKETTTTTTTTTIATKTKTVTTATTATAAATSSPMLKPFATADPAGSSNASSLPDDTKKTRSGSVVGGSIAAVLLLVGAGVVYFAQGRSSSCPAFTFGRAPTTNERDAFEQEELNRNTLAMATNPLASPTAATPPENDQAAADAGNESGTEVYYSTIAETQLDGSGYVDDSFPENKTVYATYAGSGIEAGGVVEAMAYATPATDVDTYNEARTSADSALAYATPSDAGPVYIVPLQHGGVAYAQSGAGESPADVYAVPDSAA